MSEIGKPEPGSDIFFTSYFIPLSIVGKWPPPSGANAERRTWYVPYAIFLQVIAALCVAIRFYATYTKRIRAFGIDDVLIIGGMVFAIAFTASSIYGVLHAGFDTHIWENLLTGEQAGFVAWISEILFLASNCLTKLSVLHFQRRLIQRTHNPIILRAIDLGIAFTIVYFFAFVLFLMFACSPTNASWKSMNINYNQPYKCVHRNVIDPMVGALSAVSDVYALIVPEILIYKLRMERKKKVVLYIIFGSGLIVSGAGLARAVWLGRLSTDSLRDLTWVGYNILVWTQLEQQVALITACAPALKAFISNVKTGETRTGGSTYKGSNYGTELNSGSNFQSGTNMKLEKEIAYNKGILVEQRVSLNSVLISSSASGKSASKPFNEVTVETNKLDDINEIQERPSFSSPTRMSPSPADEIQDRSSFSSQTRLDKSYSSSRSDRPSPVEATAYSPHATRYPIDDSPKEPASILHGTFSHYPTEHYTRPVPVAKNSWTNKLSNPANRSKAMRVLEG
ncbi:hypothetical protein BT63DRAFT_130797 [Microthyrium microscopicum]|uniref:Rhodopsin domain-containing protein n=1 Tax=Microthyrium microscopicum TaxID=703497 RepID=A0A6A6UNU5_9PEZI|nr:hypothetical protein BT63DRAFT_130797 [Microthyrium microscopicum]